MSELNQSAFELNIFFDSMLESMEDTIRAAIKLGEFLNLHKNEMTIAECLAITSDAFLYMKLAEKMPSSSLTKNRMPRELIKSALSLIEGSEITKTFGDLI